MIRNHIKTRIKENYASGCSRMKDKSLRNAKLFLVFKYKYQIKISGFFFNPCRIYDEISLRAAGERGEEGGIKDHNLKYQLCTVFPVAMVIASYCRCEEEVNCASLSASFPCSSPSSVLLPACSVAVVFPPHLPLSPAPQFLLLPLLQTNFL